MNPGQPCYKCWKSKSCLCLWGMEIPLFVPSFKPKSARGFSLLQWLPCRCLFSSCTSVYLLGLGGSPGVFQLGFLLTWQHKTSLSETAQSFPDLTTTSLGCPEIPRGQGWLAGKESRCTEGRRAVPLLWDTQEMQRGGWVSAWGTGMFQPCSQTWERPACTNTQTALCRLAQSGQILLSSCVLEETRFFTDYSSNVLMLRHSAFH